MAEAGLVLTIDEPGSVIPSIRTSGRQVNVGHPGWSDDILRVMKVTYGQDGRCRLLLPLDDA